MEEYQIIQVLILVNLFIEKVAKEEKCDSYAAVYKNQKDPFRKKIYEVYIEKTIEENGKKSSGQDLADLINFFSKKLHKIKTQNLATTYDFGDGVSDNTLRKLCEITGFEYDNLLWQPKKMLITSINEKLNESQTITSLFFETYRNQLKKNSEDLEKYCGTYNFFAIKNLELGKNDEIITQKVIEISKNKNNTFEIIEKADEEIYQGTVFKIGNYIALSLLETQNQAINDIVLILFKISPYDKNIMFFQAAYLSVNHDQTPTFGEVILQKIPEGKEKNYKSAVYTLENLHTLFEAKKDDDTSNDSSVVFSSTRLFETKKDDDTRLELEKRILYLLYQHYSLGQAQISVEYLPAVDSFLKEIPYYNSGADFSTNLKNILDNKPAVKPKADISHQPLNVKSYKIVFLRRYSEVEYEIEENEEEINLDTKESENFFFEDVGDIIFTSCWNKVDRKGYSCIVYNTEKNKFSKLSISNMLLVIKKSIALSNYSVRKDYNEKLGEYIKYNDEYIEKYKGNYINFFRCKGKDKNEMIGFNIISLLEETLTIRSTTLRDDQSSTYDGWWIPLLEIIEKPQSFNRASKIINICQDNGVMLYTFNQENKKRVLLGVGHYTIGRMNEENTAIIGVYSGESIDGNLHGGTDIFLKLPPNVVLHAKELYPASEFYDFFDKLITTFDISLSQNKNIDFNITEILDSYNKI